MKPIKFLAVLAALLIAGCAHKTDVRQILTLYDKIFSYGLDARSGKSEVYFLTQTPFRFAKDCPRYGDRFLVVSTGDHSIMLFDPKNSSFLPFFNGFFGRVYISGNSFLTFSTNFEPGKGYAVRLYSIDTNSMTPAGPDAPVLYVDLFVSGSRTDGDKVYLAGRDSKRKADAVYCFDCGNKTVKLVMEVPYFCENLKLAGEPGRLAIYPSAVGPAETYDRYWTYDAARGTVTTNRLESAYSFYGDGFVFGGKVYLPAVSQDGSFSLVGLSNSAVVSVDPLPTGVFTALTNIGDRIFYVGCNLFRDREDYYFADVRLGESNASTLIPLR